MTTQHLAEDVERFLSFVEPDVNTGCWLWSGCYDKNTGYNRFWLKGKMSRAHRAGYELMCEPIPEGMIACHKCDTPACVNPAHIFIGTVKDNAQDAIKKGRLKGGKGSAPAENHPRAKLTNAQARAIYALRSDKSRTQKQIGKEFGVSASTVRLIQIGKHWPTATGALQA
jgi:hypothetical protein